LPVFINNQVALFWNFFNHYSNLEILQGSLKLNFSGFLVIPPFDHFRGKIECVGGREVAGKTER